MKFEDLKVGDYTYREYETTSTINVILSIIDKGARHSVQSIDLNNKSFKTTPASMGNHLKSIRLATKKEKHWLNACIKANKFIPEEEALKNFNKCYKQY